MLEVELKFHLLDEAALRRELAQFAIDWQPAEEQVDCYFNHPARDFAQTDEAVRLRQMGNENVITYKGPKLDPTTKTRREIELPIVQGKEGLVQFGQLLEVLSFRRVAEVRKLRTTGKFTWQRWPVEVALEESDLPAARSAILKLATRLNLTEQERRGYLEMLLSKR